jgi:hypothetical protein
MKARNCNSARQVCVLCRATQQHTAVALVCSRLNMETRRALATLRHLVRQASHVLWHVCGTEVHQNHSVSFVKDTMELVNIHSLQLSLTKARGMSGVSVVLDLGVQSKHYKRVLRKSRTLRKTLIARPAPSRARLSADCGCAVSRSWLFENKAGVTFGDVFNAVDALGSHRCETCLSKYYVRVRSAYGGS